MAGSFTYTAPPPRLPWRLLVAVGALGILGLGGWWWTHAPMQTKGKEPATLLGGVPQWANEQVAYPAKPALAAPPAHDELADLRAMLREQQLLLAKQGDALDELRKRPPPPQATAKPVDKPVEKPKPARWKLTDMAVGKPLFPQAGSAQSAKGPDGEQRTADGQLITPAHWELPAEPWKVLYSSQRVCGHLLDAVNSSIPGDLRIQVAHDVMDRFNQRYVLIPQHAIVKGSTEGRPIYGDTRIPVGIAEVEFPGGEVVALGGRLTDKSGAVGGEAHVDNHLDKLALGVLLSAAMGIGTRAPFGSVQDSSPNITQELMREVGQGANTASQEIIRRQLMVRPTLTLDAGDFVCVQLAGNHSFARPATSVQ